MLRNEWLKTVVFLTSIAALASPSAQAVLIDDFSVGAITIVETTAPVTQVQTGLPSAHIAGGERRLSTGIDGGNGPGKSIVVDTTTRAITLASGPTSLGYFRVEYGSQTPLELDLAANGETHLEVVFKKTGVDAASSTRPIDFYAFSPTGNHRLSFGSAVPFGGDSYAAHAAFIDYPNVDFRNLSGLTFEMGRYPRDATFTVYSIKSVAVPEPTTGLLFAAGTGLLSIAARRR